MSSRWHALRDTYRLLLGGTRGYILTFALVDASFLLTDRRWVGERAWTLDWASGGTFISGPLLAGFTCYLAHPLLNQVNRRAFGLTHPLTASKAVALATARGALVGWVGHALTLAAAILATELTRPTDSYHGWYATTTLLPLVMYAAIGALLATVLGRTVGPVVATLSALALGYTGLFGVSPNVLTVGGHVGSLVGYDYAVGVLLAGQLVVVGWTVAFAVAAVALVHGLHTVRPGLALAGVMFVTVSLVGAGVTVENRTVLAAAPPQQVCDAGVPQVCLNAGHTRSLHTVAKNVREALAPLSATGAEVPTTYAERAPERAVAPGIGVLDLNAGSLNYGRFDIDDYVYAVTIPGDCAAYRGSLPPEDLLHVQQYLVAWLLNELTGEEMLGPHATDGLDDQWVRDAVSELRSCHVTPLTLDPIS